MDDPLARHISINVFLIEEFQTFFQKVQKYDFQSELSMAKINQFWFFLSNEEL